MQHRGHEGKLSFGVWKDHMLVKASMPFKIPCLPLFLPPVELCLLMGQNSGFTSV